MTPRLQESVTRLMKDAEAEGYEILVALCHPSKRGVLITHKTRRYSVLHRAFQRLNVELKKWRTRNELER